MSLTSKQIDELRAYAKDRKGELAKLITDAADTIEMLSAKLHASQMERSSQYYHGGWIPCSERMPERPERVQIQMKNSWIITGYYDGEAWYPVPDDGVPMDDEYVKAWMPLPEPWREEEQ